MKNHLNVLSNTENLALIRRWIIQLIRDAGLTEYQKHALILAVDEACSNVMEHAYPDIDNGPIDIVCTINEESVVITIRDTGKNYSPNVYQEPDLNRSIRRSRPGGYGVSIMKSLMDEIEFVSSDSQSEGQNEIRMVKHLERNFT